MEPATSDSLYILTDTFKWRISKETKTNLVSDKPSVIIKGTFQNQWIVDFQDVKNKDTKTALMLIIIKLSINKNICFFFHDEKLYKYH